MNDAPKSGFPLWILAIVISAAMPLLLCGGVLMLVVYWLWEAPTTHQLGGPVAIVERDAPLPEMELRPDGPVRVDDILTDYADDGVAAVRKYDDKPIIVIGKAKRIERRRGLAVVYLYPLTGKTFFWEVCRPYVLCKFDRMDDVAGFRKGDTLTVYGWCDGQPKTNRDRAITLIDCEKK
jgi:hypothetical protein